MKGESKYKRFGRPRRASTPRVRLAKEKRPISRRGTRARGKPREIFLQTAFRSRVYISVGKGRRGDQCSLASHRETVYTVLAIMMVKMSGVRLSVLLMLAALAPVLAKPAEIRIVKREATGSSGVSVIAFPDSLATGGREEPILSEAEEENTGTLYRM